MPQAPSYRETLRKRPIRPFARKVGRHIAVMTDETVRAEKLAQSSHKHFASIQGRKHYGI